ncbi:hypothetical protein B0A48_11328 [Cryoendolithus antarcticus]|uniref:Uncharacterized protein n=1 Tax=Cryoendolithus antarcticus TaxID=1507870 RepID=A0A1V8SVF9_9PEZI|nr:hypothetical protein B0A48_11328 [Cryoendolithus antarcticus]
MAEFFDYDAYFEKFGQQDDFDYQDPNLFSNTTTATLPLDGAVAQQPLVPNAVNSTAGEFNFDLSMETPAQHMAPMQQLPVAPMTFPATAMGAPQIYGAPANTIFQQDFALEMPQQLEPANAIGFGDLFSDTPQVYPTLNEGELNGSGATANALIQPNPRYNAADAPQKTIPTPPLSPERQEPSPYEHQAVSNYAQPQIPTYSMADHTMYQQPTPAETLEQAHHFEDFNAPPALQGGAPASANMNRVNDNGTRATTKTKKARVAVIDAEEYDKTTFDHAMARINRFIVHGADGMLRVGKQPPRREDRNWNPMVEHAAWTEIGNGVRKNAACYLLEDGNDKAAKRALLDRARKNRLQVPKRQADKAKKTALKAAKMVQSKLSRSNGLSTGAADGAPDHDNASHSTPCPP